MDVDKRKIREFFRWVGVFLLFPLHIPHLFFYSIGRGKFLVNYDMKRYKDHFHYEDCPNCLYLLYLLTTDCYYRQIFYNRMGPTIAALISWYRPGDKYFSIPKELKIGGGFMAFHPYSTVLNAEKIGENFTCIQCTTLGYGKGGRPTIDDNVSLGANVVIIGGVHIGKNAIIGAGSVVVKDVPDNCVVAGNPAKVIRYINRE